MSSLIPTEEQQAVVDAAAGGASLKVAAFAGTGKTSTLRLVADALRRQRILYVVFNRAMASDARALLPKHVEVRTAHSLAFASTGLPYRTRLRPSLFAARQALLDAHPELTAPLRQARLTEYGAAAAVLETVARFTQSADPEITAAHVPDVIAAMSRAPRLRGLPDAVAASARTAWACLTARDSTLPVTHDVYLKLFQLSRPALPYDLILFDEAQDANPAMLAIVTAQPRAQQVFVGDRHQALYQWRGAVNAMRTIEARELPLTQSFRFGREAARLATAILRHFKGERRPVRGAPGRSTPVTARHDEPPDAVLARSNVGVLTAALEAVDAGRRVAVAGGARPAAESLRAAWQLFCGEPVRHPEFALFPSWDALLQAIDESPAIAAQYKPYARMVERYDREIPLMCDRLEGETVDEAASPDVVCSTVHRAKGREWDAVRLADDFDIVRPAAPRQRSRGGASAPQPEAVELRPEEANVAYVAVTRARASLDLNGYDRTLRECLRLVGAPADALDCAE